MENQFNQFLSANLNKYVKVLPDTLSGKNKPQCFDLVVKWTDMLRIPHAPGNPSPFPVQYAYEIYTKFSDYQAQYFDRIYNGPYDLVQTGDIVVCSYNYNNGAGHVFVAKRNIDINYLEGVSQNDPLNSPAILKTYNYKPYILGWLRPKYLTIEQREAKAIEILKSNDNDFDKVYKLKQLYRI